MVGFFVLARLAGAGKVDIGRWTEPCGFKQKYGLPCPTCGMTTSALSFAGGKIKESFSIQPAGGPAGGLFCSVLVVAAFLAFLAAFFGVYFIFLRRFFTEVKIRHIILALIIIIAAGWLVTLAGALAVSNHG
ncbi:MAG: DUF2752 domain-containing protein [Planctomycetota bacterium]